LVYVPSLTTCLAGDSSQSGEWCLMGKTAFVVCSLVEMLFAEQQTSEIEVRQEMLACEQKRAYDRTAALSRRDTPLVTYSKLSG
jgi:hypothetical protein